MKKSKKPESTLKRINRSNRALIALVSLLFGAVGAYAIQITHAAAPYQFISLNTSQLHCESTAPNSSRCWQNMGDNLNFGSFYKKNVKNPNGKLTCWAVTSPPLHYPANGLDYFTSEQLMKTAPVFTRIISPVPPSGILFDIQTEGTTAAWCRTDLFDGTNILGTSMFGLGAPGQTTEN